MGNWAHARIRNVHTFTRPIARLSTTKPKNISDCVDIVPASGILFEAMFKLYKRLTFTQAIYMSLIFASETYMSKYVALNPNRSNSVPVITLLSAVLAIYVKIL